jgi:hypothetical protein
MWMQWKESPARYKAHKDMMKIEDVMENVNQAAQPVIRASEGVDSFVSTLQIAANSLGDAVRYVAGFSAQAASSGIVANLVLACQGAEELKKIAAHLKVISDSTAAQMSLKAPSKFAKQVYRFVQMRLAQTGRDSKNHWFFIYHPDTDWHPSFHKRLSKRKLGESFVGLSNQLDALVLFMVVVREVQAKLPKANKKPTFHILMPAYRPFVIPQPLIFPPELDPFCVEGQIHNGNPYVWLNLPYVIPGLLKDVGIFQPQRSIWEHLARAGESCIQPVAIERTRTHTHVIDPAGIIQDPPPRILGFKPPAHELVAPKRSFWANFEQKRFVVRYRDEVYDGFAHHRLDVEEESSAGHGRPKSRASSTKQSRRTVDSEGGSSLVKRRQRK